LILFITTCLFFAVDMEEHRVMQQPNDWQLSAAGGSGNPPQGDDHAWERREEFLRRRLPQTEKPEKSDSNEETGQSPGGGQPKHPIYFRQGEPSHTAIYKTFVTEPKQLLAYPRPS
jgi:hypothetical protein